METTGTGGKYCDLVAENGNHLKGRTLEGLGWKVGFSPWCFPLPALGKLRHVLSMDGFLSYLCSKDGDIFNPVCLPVYQDMTQPLSHYFINSSHNTYLVGDQLCGQSSVEGYIRCAGQRRDPAHGRGCMWGNEGRLWLMGIVWIRG